MSCGREHCITCGSTEHFELIKRLDAKQVGDQTVWTYQNKCHKCGRISEYVTENPDAIPAAIKVREEILTPAVPFNPNLAPQQDGPTAAELEEMGK